ncbi:unnamed protein product [Urochloa humidicola]
MEDSSSVQSFPSPAVGDISVTEKGLDFFASGKSGRVYIKYMQPEEATATVVTMQHPFP